MPGARRPAPDARAPSATPRASSLLGLLLQAGATETAAEDLPASRWFVEQGHRAEPSRPRPCVGKSHDTSASFGRGLDQPLAGSLSTLNTQWASFTSRSDAPDRSRCVVPTTRCGVGLLIPRGRKTELFRGALRYTPLIQKTSEKPGRTRSRIGPRRQKSWVRIPPRPLQIPGATRTHGLHFIQKT